MGRKVLPQRRKNKKLRPQPKHRMDGSFKVSKVGKYNAQGRRVDGRYFHSDAEATRYCQLKRLEEEGRILTLECQPAYQLRINGKLICTYRADFRYRVMSPTGMVEGICIEDVKGLALEPYKLKKAMLEAIYSVVLHEMPAQWVADYEGKTAIECQEIIKTKGDLKIARKKARAAKKRAAAKLLVHEGTNSETS